MSHVCALSKNRMISLIDEVVLPLEYMFVHSPDILRFGSKMDIFQLLNMTVAKLT